MKRLVNIVNIIEEYTRYVFVIFVVGCSLIEVYPTSSFICLINDNKS